MARFGLSYKVLTKKEKEEVIDMDFLLKTGAKNQKNYTIIMLKEIKEYFQKKFVFVSIIDFL